MPLRFTADGLPILDPNGFPIDVEEPDPSEAFSDGTFWADGTGWID